jgi:hypothetical protein
MSAAATDMAGAARSTLAVARSLGKGAHAGNRLFPPCYWAGMRSLLQNKERWPTSTG